MSVGKSERERESGLRENRRAKGRKNEKKWKLVAKEEEAEKRIDL